MIDAIALSKIYNSKIKPEIDDDQFRDYVDGEKDEMECILQLQAFHPMNRKNSKNNINSYVISCGVNRILKSIHLLFRRRMSSVVGAT